MGKLNLTSNFNNGFFEAIFLRGDEGGEVEGDEGVEGGKKEVLKEVEKEEDHLLS
jgi:hypothetical protein